MSYICMIANGNGIALSGDSRLTFYPQRLNLHLDRARKVFVDPDQGLIWGCCGLMVFAGVNYYVLADHILRQKHRSLASRLNQISGALTRATAAQHWLSRKPSAFTLLLGSVRDGQVHVQALDVVDGKVTRTIYQTPVLVQSGWVRSLHQPKPPVEDFAGETLDQLVKRARDRCLWAVRKDGRLALEEEGHIQTVGGNVRVVSLGNGAKPV